MSNKGPRNKLSDLNDHLFMQLERLGDEELKEEELQKEIARAKAITNTAAQIINNASLVLKSQQFLHEYGLVGDGDGDGGGAQRKRRFPRMLQSEFLGE
jgi:hypothetical protein